MLRPYYFVGLPVPVVTAVTCYACYRESNNENCNSVSTTSCSSSEMCYTIIEKYDSIGTKYTKVKVQIKKYICSLNAKNKREDLSMLMHTIQHFPSVGHWRKVNTRRAPVLHWAVISTAALRDQYNPTCTYTLSHLQIKLADSSFCAASVYGFSVKTPF